jgi:hypothetical protein
MVLTSENRECQWRIIHFTLNMAMERPSGCPRRSGSSRVSLAYAGLAGKVPRSSPPPPHDSQPIGNGFGYAVYSSSFAGLTHFFAHPYRFLAQNPKDPQGDGLETPDLIRHLKWEKTLPREASLRTARYVNESSVIEVNGKKANGETASEYFFMPFDFLENAVITGSLSANDGAEVGCMAIEWGAPGKIGSPSVHVQRLHDRTVRVVSFDKIGESVVLVPLDGDGSQVGESEGCLSGSSGWATISIEQGRDVAQLVKNFAAWQRQRNIGQLAQDSVQVIEGWRLKPKIAFRSDNELKMYRQSEVMLRMGQIREPNTSVRHSYGLINASLPPGEWFIPWVRDQSYAIEALVDMGHFAEARMGIDAWMNTRTEGKSNPEAGEIDYQISTTRYFGNGMEEADYDQTTDENGKPVVYRNFELDNWGHSLRAISYYLNKSGDRAWLKEKNYRGITNYETCRDFIVQPIYLNLESYGQAVKQDLGNKGDGLITKADTSFWEYNIHPHQHFAGSSIAVIKGLRDFKSEIASVMADGKAVRAVSQKITAMLRGFNQAFVRNGTVKGTVEDVPAYSVDGATLEAINWGVVTDPELMKGILKSMWDKRRTASGGLRRIDGEQHPYDDGEFVLMDLRFETAVRVAGSLVRCTLKPKICSIA